MGLQMCILVYVQYYIKQRMEEKGNRVGGPPNKIQHYFKSFNKKEQINPSAVLRMT